MDKVDHAYLASLFRQARGGDANAFAELFAATVQNQYRLSYTLLQDEYRAQEALQQTYTYALRDLAKLRDPNLVVSWLNQLNFCTCLNFHFRQAPEGEHRTSIDPERQLLSVDERSYSIHQVLNLPFTESQSIMLRYYLHMSLGKTAALLGIRRSAVRQNIASGVLRLRAQNGERGQAS